MYGVTWLQVYSYFSKHSKNDRPFLKCFVSVRLLVLPLPGAFKVSRLGRIAFVRPRQPHCQQMTHLEQNIGFVAVGLGRSRILCRRGNQFWRLLGRS